MLEAGILRNFSGSGAEDRATRFGMFCLALHEDETAKRFCREREILFQRATVDGNRDASYGFLIPDEFRRDIAATRAKYGAFRQNATVVHMPSDNLCKPRRDGGLVTGGFAGEHAGGYCDKWSDRVRLTARRVSVLTRYADNYETAYAANIGDDLLGEIGYSLAFKEDQCGFSGDGTAQGGGITGLTISLHNVDPDPANVPGLIVSAAKAYDRVTIDDFARTVATLPGYADQPGEVKWYCSRAFWASAMCRIMGVAHVDHDSPAKQFYGHPVVDSYVMPKHAVEGQVCCLFGNLRQAATIGSRDRVTIKALQGNVGGGTFDYVCTEQFDIACHDLGTSRSNPDPIRGVTPGAIVGLMLAIA